ncbi:unnamed protein product [Caenorhabditis auriculariae]|uniref:Uncharacterized protein n=1 Tax=Caenorhabditis auriculariae TaxID=2777116 RepID=A0A8S1HIL2_9PELO|nr:unnamed protein product [Caenorhabditis auriculariae]
MEERTRSVADGLPSRNIQPLMTIDQERRPAHTSEGLHGDTSHAIQGTAKEADLLPTSGQQSESRNNGLFKRCLLPSRPYIRSNVHSFKDGMILIIEDRNTTSSFTMRMLAELIASKIGCATNNVLMFDLGIVCSEISSLWTYTLTRATE